MAFASNAQFVSGRCSLNFTLVAALGFGLGSGLGFPIIFFPCLEVWFELNCLTWKLTWPFGIFPWQHVFCYYLNEFLKYFIGLELTLSQERGRCAVAQILTVISSDIGKEGRYTFHRYISTGDYPQSLLPFFFVGMHQSVFAVWSLSEWPAWRILEKNSSA